MGNDDVMVEGTAAAKPLGVPGGASGEEGEQLARDDYSFEEAFARLEDIVRRLESGDAGLEEALSLFEEGVRMARFCSQRLDAAETKIRMLVEDSGGALREVEWDAAAFGRPVHGE